MKTIKTLNEYEQAIQNNKEVIMIFYSSWCMDCHALEPYLDHIESVFNLIDFYYVNREEHPVIAKHLKIFGVPSIVYYYHQEVSHTWISKAAKSAGDITHFIHQSRKERKAHETF